jgi:hypothetical protein
MLSTFLALALAAPAPAPSPAPAPPAAAPALPTAHALFLLPPGERKAALQALAPEALQALFQGAPPEELATLCERNLKALGTYTVKLTSQERVKGKLLDPKTLDVAIQQEPVAIRIDYVAGPGKGRRVLYNSALRPGALRVKEPGMLGVLGGLWLDVDSSLTRDDTTHPITDTGLGSVVRNLTHDAKVIPTLAGATRVVEPVDAQGRLCIRTKSPPKSPVYAEDVRICIDVVLGLPTLVETFSAAGLMEHFAFDDVRGQVKTPQDFFTLEGAGL